MKTLKVVRKTLLLGSLVVMILFVACTDITELIGEGLLPSESNMDLNKTEIGVETYSVLKNSIITSGSESLLLGSIKDPVFGKMTADIFAQYIPSAGFDSAFHDAEFFDSLVFHFSYSGYFYGDTLTEQTIRIYELTENLNDSIYYSDQTAQYNPVEIASYTFNPKSYFDTLLNVNTASGDEVPQISIPVAFSPDHPLVSKLLEIRKEDYLQEADETGYQAIDSEKFYSFLNGFYITVDPVNSGYGSMIGINRNSFSTCLQLYKHDIFNIEKTSTLVISNITGATFNHFEHYGYQDAEFEFQDQVLNNNKELGKQKVYIQSLAGSHLRIKFPEIEALNELGDNIAINKAELILLADENAAVSEFEAPPVLRAQIQFNNDSVSFLPDVELGREFLGGIIDTIGGGIKYRFRITKYIQRLLSGDLENDDGLYLFSTTEYNQYHRVVLFGSDPENPYFEKRARLEVTYTIIE